MELACRARLAEMNYANRNVPTNRANVTVCATAWVDRHQPNYLVRRQVWLNRNLLLVETFAVFGVEVTFTCANGLGRDFDQFIVVDELKELLQRHDARGRQRSGFIRA